MTPTAPRFDWLQSSWISLATLTVLFIADSLHATHLTPALLYPIACLATIGAADARLPHRIALLATLFVVIGRFLPRGEALPTIDLTNRMISVAALWGTVAVVRHLRQYQAQLQEEEAIARVAVAERARSEHRLELSLHELHEMKVALDQSSIVSTTDTKGRIVYVNDKFCEISGFRREELIGRDHRLINSGLHPKTFFATLWQTVARGETWRGEVRNRNKNGQFWWADSTVVPLLDADNFPKQYVAIRTDVTARKDAEARLLEQASLARLGEMASVVAHEVRNPLAGVAGALQILHERMAPSSEERLIMGEVLERVEHLNGSLTDLLLYARPRPATRTRTDLHALLGDVAATTRADPRFAGIEVDVDAGEVTCDVDPDLVRSAVFNLALNAAQALKNRGHIRLHAERSSEACQISVQDDGPGIDAAIRDRIFEPFFTTKARGTGLGLAIVKRVAEQHGGTVRISSPAEGGTVAQLDLPARPITTQ